MGLGADMPGMSHLYDGLAIYICLRRPDAAPSRGGES